MVYKNIATTVFTPLELGTVGLNEQEAVRVYIEHSYLNRLLKLHTYNVLYYNKIDKYGARGFGGLLHLSIHSSGMEHP